MLPSNQDLSDDEKKISEKIYKNIFIFYYRAILFFVSLISYMQAPYQKKICIENLTHVTIYFLPYTTCAIEREKNRVPTFFYFKTKFKHIPSHLSHLPSFIFLISRRSKWLRGSPDESGFLAFFFFWS